MKLLSPNTVWGLGGIAIGVVISDTSRNGWRAIALLIVGMFGKWVIYRVASTFFDDEMSQVRRLISIHDDPIKAAIWAHALENHPGKLFDCKESTCRV